MTIQSLRGRAPFACRATRRMSVAPMHDESIRSWVSRQAQVQQVDADSWWLQHMRWAAEEYMRSRAVDNDSARRLRFQYACVEHRRFILYCPTCILRFRCDGGPLYLRASWEMQDPTFCSLCGSPLLVWSTGEASPFPRLAETPRDEALEAHFVLIARKRCTSDVLSDACGYFDWVSVWRRAANWERNWWQSRRGAARIALQSFASMLLWPSEFGERARLLDVICGEVSRAKPHGPEEWRRTSWVWNESEPLVRRTALSVAVYLLGGPREARLWKEHLSGRSQACTFEQLWWTVQGGVTVEGSRLLRKSMKYWPLRYRRVALREIPQLRRRQQRGRVLFSR